MVEVEGKAGGTRGGGRQLIRNSHNVGNSNLQSYISLRDFVNKTYTSPIRSLLLNILI